LPLTSLAAEAGKGLISQNQKKTEATASRKAGVIKTYGKLPLYFIENNGQVDNKVSFYERGAGHATFFTSKGVVIGLTKGDVKVDKTARLGDIKKLEAKKSEKVNTDAVSLSFVGANAKAKIITDEKKSGHVNYFVGNDKSKWRSGIPTYGVVTYKEVYKNIDIKFYGNNRQLEHDVIVSPGGDISSVRFAYDGIEGLKINKEGDLEVNLKEGRIIEQRPVIYQNIDGKRVAVDGSYRIFENSAGAFTYGFTVASYDHTKQIVIDPVLVYSTYLGGSSVDSGYAIALDSSGAAYITGYALSADFPLVSPIQGGALGMVAFITKINPAGSALVYSTYLGGSVDDYSTGIAVDSSGAAYITGDTYSTDFPLKNPIQAVKGGADDAFITKINPAGSALVYSTYLGGIGGDNGNAIAVDLSGVAYITGITLSTDFPLKNPIQAVKGGAVDAFVTTVNAAGSAYIYSTYLGGSSDDRGQGIAVDSSGNAYVTGGALSFNFPLFNPIQAVYGGGQDAFVTKLNPTGSAYVYSTYLGGSLNDSGNSIALDSSGAAYITGYTYSTDFPLMNPIQAVNGGADDAFITKINPVGSVIVYSTYLGGTDQDTGSDIAVDSSGNAYVTGGASSSNFPLFNPTQAVNGGWKDAFVTKLNSTGSAYIYSTYLGGSGHDSGNGIAVDSSGNTYVTGSAGSSDFPTASPFQSVYAGGVDAFITKISGSIIPPSPVVTLTLVPDIANVLQGTNLGYNVTVTNTTAVRQCFNYWENVNLPGGTLFPAKNSLFKPVPRICLNGGASNTVHLTHGIPFTAPIGAYVFNSYVGIFPFNFRDVVDTTSFNFNVTTGVAPIPSPRTSWRVIENGFRR